MCRTREVHTIITAIQGGRGRVAGHHREQLRVLIDLRSPRPQLLGVPGKISLVVQKWLIIHSCSQHRTSIIINTQLSNFNRLHFHSLKALLFLIGVSFFFYIYLHAPLFLLYCLSDKQIV